MYFYGIRVCKIFPKVELLADQFLSFLKYLQISTRGFNFVRSKLGLSPFPFEVNSREEEDRSIDRKLDITKVGESILGKFSMDSLVSP